MPTPSHAAAAYRPPAASLLRDEADHHLGQAAVDASDASRRLRWLALEARHEYALEGEDWLTPEQSSHLLSLATLADQVAAGTRAALREITGRGGAS